MGFALCPDVGERSRVVATEYIKIDRIQPLRTDGAPGPDWAALEALADLA